MSLDQELLKKFNNKILNNISLTNYSWFNLGGPAEYFFKPENTNQLKEFIRYNRKNKLKITILGAGSNTLIRDRGINLTSFWTFFRVQSIRFTGRFKFSIFGSHLEN